MDSDENHLNETTLDVISEKLGLSRRELLASGGFTLSGAVSMSLVGCKTSNRSSLETTSPIPSTAKFLDDILLAEKATPVTVPPTDPTFPDAAQARTIAVSKVVGDWLKHRPYSMIDELLADQSLTVFKRDIGPAIVFRHPHVIECLSRTQDFTVAPYAGEMAQATDGAHDFRKRTDFMLGTDDEVLYRPDAKILRRALLPEDRLTLLPKLISNACQSALKGKSGAFDAVTSICRLVPVEIVSKYLGVPTYEENESSFMNNIRGGEVFKITPDLMESFKYTITEAEVPTSQIMYEWVLAAFRNIFNNLSPLDENYSSFRAAGRMATQQLSAYIHKVILYYKPKVYANEPNLPATMLVRLLKMQKLVKEGGGAALATEIGITVEDLAARLEDGRIRSNVFGTVVGGIVNPEEGSARMLDSILRLKDNEYTVANGSDYNKLKDAVANPSPANDEVIRLYALEALRLQPQGEVVIRRSDKTKAVTIANVTIPKDTLVFVAYASAMRDPTVVSNPKSFDITRDQMHTAFEGKPGEDRPKELPQSQLYLQHGYGRHKCLGRYASEATLVETLRAVVKLGDIKRASPLNMDAQKLYATRLMISV